MEPNVNQGGHATAGAQPRPFLLHKQRSVAPELERAARVEFTGSVGRPLTDKEWTAVRANLLTFVDILRAWDHGRRINESKGGEVTPPVESYPKAA